MNPSDEFLKRAAECEQMAKFARDPQGKAGWRRMAERWRSCAKKFSNEAVAGPQQSPKRSRMPASAASP